MQKYSLKTISKIESGKSFRKKPEENPEGNCLLLQMKDVSINGITDSPLKISMEDINPNNLLKNGDILFVAKGNHNYATTFRSTEPTVAISAFFVIRPDISRVYPEYLAWYINSPEAQKQFEKGRMGATVGNIRINVLEELEVPLPNIETQIAIESVSNLWNQEKETTKKLLEQKDIYYSNLLTKISTNEIKPKEPEDIREWYDIWTHSNYYPAVVKLKSPIKIDGKETDELVCTFHHLETKPTTFNKGDGASITVQQVSSWDYILTKDLNVWNDPNVPHTIKESTVLKNLNHSLVKSIALKDRATNKTILEKVNER